MYDTLYLRESMKKSYLIQRLEKPQNFVNPFSFGGGLTNGGLSENAMALLKSIWSFDYMGAAEFEFGAVPEALRFLAEQGEKDNLVFDRIRKDNDKKHSFYVIYYICPKPYETEVIERITKLASDKNEDYNLKEPTLLTHTLSPENPKYKPNIQGWLELDNGYMFFTDEAMFQATKKLFSKE